MREDVTERSAEEQPLLTSPVPSRVMIHDVSTPPAPPQVVGVSHEGDIVSADTVPPPATTVYDDIQGFQNQQVTCAMSCNS